MTTFYVRIALGFALAAGTATAASANLCLGCSVLFQDAPGFGLVGTLTNGDNFGRAVAVGDFNGDGYDDVALFDRESAVVSNAGAVHVLYSNLHGVSPDDDYFTDFIPGSGLPDEEPGDEFGSALAAGDFDGDGYDDLAIGIYLEDLVFLDQGEVQNCGAVLVLYGTSTGLQQAGAQKLASTTESDRTDAHFGFALATGDFDGDGFDELAVGAPTGDVSGQDQAGYIVVHDGGAAGLAAVGRIISQDSSDGTGSVSDTAEALDRFGWSLAAGNFNGDTNGAGGPTVDDIVVGAPGEGDGVALTQGSGVVHIFYGDGFGSPLAFNTDQLVNQANTQTGQSIETGDSFGFVLASGDVNGDGLDDLVVASPQEDVVFGPENVQSAGLVTVIRGGNPVVPSAGAVSFADALGIGEIPDPDDFFGLALAVADFDADGLADIAVGTPFEDVEDPITFATIQDAGAVTIVPGWTTFFPSPVTAPEFVAQRYGAHAGTLDTGDLYGHGLAGGDFDGDGHADLAVGAPGEDADVGTGTVADAGALYVLPGSLFSDGFETGNTVRW
jgi:hypothetical protein